MSDEKPSRKGTVLPGWVPKRSMLTPLSADVRQPAPFDDGDQRALKALRDGTATAEQQHRALGWLLFALGNRRQPYMANDRDTAYALGMQQVARQIYDLLEAAVRGSAEDEQGSR